MTGNDVLDFVARADGDRLDTFLAAHSDQLTRSRVQRLIAGGHVTVDGLPVKASTRLRAGQTVHVSIPPPEPSRLVPQPMPLDVVYEDQELMVIDKPAGLTVHPAPGHRDHTLANAVLAHVPALEGVDGSLRPGIVHRLDKDTSGLLVVAKSETAHAHLAAQFKERKVTKAYLALVHGRVSQLEATIEAPVGRHPKDRKRMAVVSNGRQATTPYKVVTRFKQYTLIEALPTTGRTHQIRVHLASIGHPLAGDATYGRPDPPLERHFLHASLLGFRLPSSDEYVEHRSELPPDLRAFLDSLE